MLSRDRCAGVIKAVMEGSSALESSTRRSRLMLMGSVRSVVGSAEDDRFVFFVFMFMIVNSVTSDD